MFSQIQVLEHDHGTLDLHVGQSSVVSRNWANQGLVQVTIHVWPDPSIRAWIVEHLTYMLGELAEQNRTMSPAPQVKVSWWKCGSRADPACGVDTQIISSLGLSSPAIKCTQNQLRQTRPCTSIYPLSVRSRYNGMKHGAPALGQQNNPDHRTMS